MQANSFICVNRKIGKNSELELSYRQREAIEIVCNQHLSDSLQSIVKEIPKIQDKNLDKKLCALIDKHT